MCIVLDTSLHICGECGSRISRDFGVNKEIGWSQNAWRCLYERVLLYGLGRVKWNQEQYWDVSIGNTVRHGNRPWKYLRKAKADNEEICFFIEILVNKWAGDGLPSDRLAGGGHFYQKVDISEHDKGSTD